MDIVASRIFLYSILPLIIAIGQVGLDKSSRSRDRKIETFLLYLFGVGVAGSGIGGFFGHFFISDSVAQSIGWPTGNPFQLEVGFANLAVGILGIVAMSRRDGFREATVIAVTAFGVGATRRRLCHRSAGYRHVRWDPGRRRSGGLRRSSF